MRHRLAEQLGFPPEWAAALSAYGYETVEHFLSTCAVPDGRAALAAFLDCPLERLATVEAQLLTDCGMEAPPTPHEAQMGALGLLGPGGNFDE